MYRLSKLPIEILYHVFSYLDTEDLVTLARMNTWYGYWLSIMLSERIDKNVKNEGWRIHIDILAKSYPSNQSHPTFPFSTELLLLGEFARINPFTLTVEFKLCPIDEEGLDSITDATPSDCSIVLFDDIKTNIDIVAYFAQIATSRRLQHVNQAGAAMMSDKKLWYQYNHHTKGSAVMGTGFQVKYDMKETRQEFRKLVDAFEQHHGKLSHAPAIISFDRLWVSPEWWVKQIKLPTLWNEQQEGLEHSYW
ncbi:uncharacterized protein B0P05DRAFT_636022 [Gilbertella persicaria]|uniref:F-box domain-containing protein n=1 Tax=Rhizopus stolonifer TaxID=4846 RepID=A0A367KSE0_RHIST|nr:uncharacterized protein B0P05DRAFT_636022 [Gilbertella persicaria]KAI8084302.1 hypothetical protein B0P05DRAFT_636022 [Gilbertella persicaria]RCI04772.1 hypothetical protein CU098_008423 [Rhizopus stolonifer]